MISRRLLFSACLPVAVWASACPAQVHTRSFVFDGQVRTTPGLTFRFDRGAATLDDAAQPVAPDQPRFGPPRLLCAMPEVRTVPGTTGIGSLQLLAGGELADGTTPVWILLDGSRGYADIIVGQDTAAPHRYLHTGNPLKGGVSDFLGESADASPDEAWALRAAVVCHGFVIGLCNVAVRDASDQFIPNRLGVVTCNLADVMNGPKPTWWRRHALSDVLTPATADVFIGKSWSMRHWSSLNRDGTPPLEAWACLADYRASPNKDGGVFCLMRFSRPDAASSAWSPGPLVELPGRFTSVENITHAHALAVTPYGPSGMLAFGSRGDGLYNNVNYTWTIDESSRYADGAELTPGGDQWWRNPTGWAGPREVNGGILLPSDDPSRRRVANQWVGIAPGPTVGTFLATADETNQPMWVSDRVDTNPALVGFTPTAYLPIASNWILGGGATRNRFLGFQITTPRPNALGGPYVAQMGPGQFADERTNSQRVVYSPDGVRWGQCWAHRENEQTAPMIVDGRIYTGSFGKNTMQGVRSIAMPTTRTMRPLRISPGGTNLVAPGAPVVNISPAATVEAVVDLGSVPAPPSLGPIYRVRFNPGPGQGDAPFMASWRLADRIPPGSDILRLRLWVRPTPISEGGPAGSTLIQARLRSTDADGADGTEHLSLYTDPVILPGAGAWTPVLFNTRPSDWGPQPGGTRLDLELQTYPQTAVPGDFLIAFDSLVEGLPSAYPSGPGAVAPHERASISGLGLTGDFTILLVGMIPFDAWDASSGATLGEQYPMFALSNGAGDRWAQVSALPLNSEIQFAFWNGAEYVDSTKNSNGYQEPGTPMYFAVTHHADDHVLNLWASTSGVNFIVGSLVDYDFQGPIESIVFNTGSASAGGAMDWFGGAVEPRVMSAGEITAAMRTLSPVQDPPCAADFNRDGFVSGDDFDAYVAAFEAGDAAADFNVDGFVSGDDFDLFVAAFEAGC